MYEMKHNIAIHIARNSRKLFFFLLSQNWCRKLFKETTDVDEINQDEVDFKRARYIIAFRLWPLSQRTLISCSCTRVRLEQMTWSQAAQDRNNKAVESDATVMKKQGQTNCKELPGATINNDDDASQLSTKQFQYRWLILCKSDYFHSNIFPLESFPILCTACRRFWSFG